VVEIPEVLCQN